MTPQRPAHRDGGRRGLGRPARRPAARRRCSRAGRRCRPSASAARRWPRRASRPGGRTTSWRCAATSRCCATTARSSASATQLAERLLRERPDALHRRRRARLQPRPRGTPEGAGHQAPCTSSARRSGPGAASASRRSRAAVDHVLCLFPFEPALLRQARRARRPTSATRWPTRSRSRCRVPRAARALGLGGATRWSRCCRAAGAPRSQYIAPRSAGAPPSCMQRARPSLRFVLPVVPGLRHAARAAAPRSTPATCRSTCSTAGRTRRWRPAT